MCAYKTHASQGRASAHLPHQVNPRRASPSFHLRTKALRLLLNRRPTRPLVHLQPPFAARLSHRSRQQSTPPVARTRRVHAPQTRLTMYRVRRPRLGVSHMLICAARSSPRHKFLGQSNLRRTSGHAGHASGRTSGHASGRNQAEIGRKQAETEPKSGRNQAEIVPKSGGKAGRQAGRRASKQQAGRQLSLVRSSGARVPESARRPRRT